MCCKADQAVRRLGVGVGNRRPGSWPISDGTDHILERALATPSPHNFSPVADRTIGDRHAFGLKHGAKGALSHPLRPD
jgi:hypothetical protein